MHCIQSCVGGAREDRTPDLLRARQALSQLSYGPFLLVFFPLGGVALVTRSVTYMSMLLHLLRRATPPNEKNPAQNPFSSLCVVLTTWKHEKFQRKYSHASLL